MIIFKKLLYKIQKLLAKFPDFKFDWGRLFLVIFFTAVVFWLGSNIYTAYNKGVDTIAKLETERTKLDNLRVQNAKLKEDLNHYESLEYKKIYARENLNMADKNEWLYYVDRPKPIEIIEGLPEQKVQITMVDSFSYWKKLILGL